MVAWKGSLPDGIKDVGVKGCGVIHYLSGTDEGELPILVVRQVGTNAQGKYIAALPEPVFKGNFFCFQMAPYFPVPWRIRSTICSNAW